MGRWHHVEKAPFAALERNRVIEASGTVEASHPESAREG
jgi:hypothetical protein